MQAMIFDSVFNSYRGIEVYFRVFNGTINKGDKVKFVNTGRIYEAEEIVILKLKQEPKTRIGAGNVGYLISGIKIASEVKVGDTITHVANPSESIKGFEDVKPMVFAGIYPVETSDYEELRASMEKLQLNDASLVWEPETSVALGFGFRCGFLGMLHMDIVQERLQREYDLNLILTTPNVQFLIHLKSGETIHLESPAELPDSSLIDSVEEPYLTVTIFTPVSNMDGVMELAKGKRGIFISSEYVSDRMKIIFDIPLSEVIVDFNDMVKSITRGYGSIDYKFKGYVSTKIAKLDILINDKVCDAFSCLVHKDHAYDKGLALVTKLKDLIPQQLFEVRVQATCDGRVISSAKIRSQGKNVAAKCYGGDITRKRKLWEKQKEGKKRMKQVGNVEIPQDAFLIALKL